MLATLYEDGPRGIWIEEGFQGDQSATKDSEVGIEVKIFGAGFVLSENSISDPVVEDFAPGPMPADELGELLGASSLNGAITDVEGGGGFAALMGGAFALDDREAAGKSQVGFGRFEGVNLYGAFVESAMSALGLFGVGKKGVMSVF